MSVSPSRLPHLIPLLTVQAVGFACGLIGVRWTSAIVPPDVLGFYSLLISTHTLAAFVTHQGIVQHVQRYWGHHVGGRAYARLLLGATARPTLWLAIGLVGIVFFLRASAPLAWSWWLWMLVVNLLVLGTHVAHVALQAEQRYWTHCAVSAIGSLTRSFLPLLLVTAGSATLATLGAGFMLHAALWVLAAAWALRSVWQREPAASTESIPPAQSMVGAFLGVGLCGWIAASAPRWFAALALSPETTGYFMLAANLSAIVPAAISLVGVGYTFPPLLAASRAGASDAALLRVTHRNVLVSVVAGQIALLALGWCGPALVGPIVDARYAPAMDWLLASGGAALSTVSASFYCTLLTARNRELECFRLLLASTVLRLLIMAALAVIPGDDAFRTGLSLLTWPTIALEAWLVHRWLSAPHDIPGD